MSSAELIRLLIGFVLIANTMSMGFQVTLAELAVALRSPGRIALWAVANFILFPAATIALLRVFSPTPIVSAGFLVLAVCAGSPQGPRLAAKGRGDLPAAVGQMFALGLLSAVVSPVLLTVGLPYLLSADNLVQIDVPAILRALLLSQVLPLAAGLCLHAWKPQWTARLERPVRVVAIVALLTVLGLVIAREFDQLALIRARGWLGMLLLFGSSIGIGWICGGPEQAHRRTLALTTAARNSPVALVIVSQSFSGTPAMTAAVAYSLVSIFGSLGCARLFARLAGTGFST